MIGAVPDQLALAPQLAALRRSFRGDVLTDFSFIEHSFGLTPAGGRNRDARVDRTRPRHAASSRPATRGRPEPLPPDSRGRVDVLDTRRRGRTARSALPDGRHRGPGDGGGLARPRAVHPLRPLRRGRARPVRLRRRVRDGLALAARASSRASRRGRARRAPGDARRAQSRTFRRSDPHPPRRRRLGRRRGVGDTGAQPTRTTTCSGSASSSPLSPRHADILLVTGAVTDADARAASPGLGDDARPEGRRRRRHGRMQRRRSRARRRRRRGAARRRLRPRAHRRARSRSCTACCSRPASSRRRRWRERRLRRGDARAHRRRGGAAADRRVALALVVAAAGCVARWRRSASQPPRTGRRPRLDLGSWLGFGPRSAALRRGRRASSSPSSARRRAAVVDRAPRAAARRGSRRRSTR